MSMINGKNFNKLIKNSLLNFSLNETNSSQVELKVGLNISCWLARKFWVSINTIYTLKLARV